MGRIVDIQMVRLAKLLEDRKITIQLDAKARDWLAEKGYDPAYGARPLKRAIQKAVQDPLAELILSGKIKDGEKVAISADKQGITFNGEVASRRRKPPAARSPAEPDKLGARFSKSRAEVFHELRQFGASAGRAHRHARAPALDRLLARDPVSRARRRAGGLGVGGSGMGDG